MGEHRDLEAEGHVRALSVWVELAGIAGILFGLALLFDALVLGGPKGSMYGIVGEFIAGPIACVAGAAAFSVGRSLARGSRFARSLLIGSAAGCSLLMLESACSGALTSVHHTRWMLEVVGLAAMAGAADIAAYIGLMSSAARRVFTESYREVLNSDPSHRAPFHRSPCFYLPPAGILLFIVMNWCAGALGR